MGEKIVKNIYNGVDKQSPRFTLNERDWHVWAKNALIFLGPTILVFIASLVAVVPQDWKYGALTLYALNLLADLLRKYLDGQK